MENNTSWQRTQLLLKVCRDCLFALKQFHSRLGSGIAIFEAIVVLAVITYGWNLFPVAPGAKEKQIFEVPYGTTLRQAGRLLQARGLIRSELVLEIYMRLNPKERMVKAGRYQIGPGMNIPQIVNELRRGVSEQIKVTIPEGLTITETAELLAGKGLVDRERFLVYLKDPRFIEEKLGGFAGNTLEGYLFPDTYYFRSNATEVEIIMTMLNRFKEVFATHFKDVSLSQTREIVILASIVEKEAQKAEERPVIAGVFMNRIKIGYPLQSCATVQYVLGKHKDRLTYKDLEVQSPYNTYLHRGLPPAPIANPGLASLIAAARPAAVDYLYFVAKPNGSHVFSKSFEQHLRAQRDIESTQSLKQ
jgi:UPF0755 protein